MRCILYRLGLILLLLWPSTVRALSVTVSTTDSVSVVAHVSWPEALPDFIADRLERGIPSTLGVQVELWRERSAWYDTSVGVWIYEAQLAREPWSGAYALITSAGTTGADSLSTLRRLASELDLPLPLSDTTLDSTANYRVAVTAVIRPITASDLREVETWLGGELGSRRGPLLGIPRGLFGIVRDLSGLGDRREKARSGRFRLVPKSQTVDVIPLAD